MSVALLAPVPEEHLLSGIEVCATAGKVAFGSRAFQLFRDLDVIRGDQTVDAYIYASASSKFGPPKVRWKARYIGHVEARGGAHPDGMKVRPASTSKYDADNSGHWAVFWEVDGLRLMHNDEAIPTSHFRGWRSRKYYVSSFVPERPLLVDPPHHQ